MGDKAGVQRSEVPCSSPSLVDQCRPWTDPAELWLSPRGRSRLQGAVAPPRDCQWNTGSLHWCCPHHGHRTPVHRPAQSQVNGLISCELYNVHICQFPSKYQVCFETGSNGCRHRPRYMGQFFLVGGEPLSHLSAENIKFRQRPKKTPMLTCKIALPNSPHPVIVSKNPGFRALFR